MCNICASIQTYSDKCQFEDTPVSDEVLTGMGQDLANVNEGSDAPSTTSTSYVMNPGDDFSGSIDFAYDTDWVAVNLTAGTTYHLQVDAGSINGLNDTTVWLMDSDGNQMAYNDDEEAGSYFSSIYFIAEETATYYVAVGAYGTGTGSYVMQVDNYGGSQLSHYTHDQIATQLTNGYWESSGREERSFDISGGAVLNVDITDLTSQGQQLATWALQSWTFVTGITFNFVDESAGAFADITFDDNDSGAYATSVTSDTTILSSHVNISTQWLSDLGTTLDSYSFQTYIHEIGHALGLGHAGNYNGSAEYRPFFSADGDNGYLNDSWQATVMSYFSQTENPQITADYAFAITPMIADILAIQSLYGTQGTQRTGNTVYGENSTAGGYLDQLVTLTANEIAFTIYDEGGTDTLDLGSVTAGQRIDLNDETSSDVAGLIGNLSIARGTIIENVISGTGDDILIGNEASNHIYGGGGNDDISGGAGYDFAHFSGNRDNYEISYDSTSGIITVQDGSTGAETSVHDDVEALAFDNMSITTSSIINPNTPPVLTIDDQNVRTMEWVRLSDVLTTHDADFDVVTTYEIYDSEGGNNWYADGALVDASTGYTTSNLGGIWFQGDAAASEQSLWVRGHDGTAWSEWTPFSVTTTVNAPPVVTVEDHTVDALQWTRLTDVIVTSDADNDPVMSYEIYDSAGGDNWYADGAIVDASTGYTTSGLNGIWFQGDATASDQTLWVRAYDGFEWGAWDQFTLTTDVNDAPVLAVENQTVDPMEWTLLSDVLSATDADGDAIMTYEIYDSVGTNSWYADGALVDASTGYTTSNLAGIWFQGDTVASDQTLWVRGYDGEDWGDWDQFVLTTDVNDAPVLTVEDQTVDTMEWTLLSDVLTATDADGDEIVTYEIYDSVGSNSWYADGALVDASTGYTTSNLAGIWFQGDAVASDQALWVRGYDGEAWGAWDQFDLITV